MPLGGPHKFNEEELRFVGICDPHFSSANPAAWSAPYLEHLEQTIYQIFRFAQKEKCHGILWAGDWFHYKAPARNPLWFVTRVMKFLKKAGIPHYGILGNHDVKYNDWTIGLQGQPAELLLESGAFHLLDDAPVVFGGNGFKLQISGASYRQGLAIDCRDLERLENVNHHLALGHFWFGKSTGEFFGERLYGPDFLQYGDPDMYLIGHHHEDQGINTLGGKTYCTAGSITRTAAHKSDLSRAPSAVYITATRDSLSARVIRPKVSPCEDVMDLRVRQQVSEEREEMEEFLSNLSNTSITTADPEEILKQLDVTQEVRAATQAYIDRAEEALAQ